MKSVIISILFSFSVFALDGGSSNHAGVYKVKSIEACGSYLVLTKCVNVDAKDMQGYEVSIVQSGDKNAPTVCLTRNFEDGIFYKREFCYSQSVDSKSTVSVNGSGFKAEAIQNELKIYSQFRRSGKEYRLTEGASSKGLNIYYNYTLEK